MNPFGVYEEGSIGSHGTQNGKKAELGSSENKQVTYTIYNAIECFYPLRDLHSET